MDHSSHRDVALRLLQDMQHAVLSEDGSNTYQYPANEHMAFKIGVINPNELKAKLHNFFRINLQSLVIEGDKFKFSKEDMEKIMSRVTQESQQSKFKGGF